ncbi:MAG TPA: metallophosphoesterase [Flavobacteriales bacterium]|nr:metallophosphoesterase [Flavobacteriales bacterium]HMR28064.1 metallophosphoesterase [Flavobacteriales bacterium]
MVIRVGLLPLLIGLLLAGTIQAQRSPFNGLEVLPADSTGHYRILIGGHFHGESTNRSGYPAATLLANLDTINSLGAHLFLSTGDLFMDPVKDLPRYQRSLFSKLKMPFFNAPGNHDGKAGSWVEVLNPGGGNVVGAKGPAELIVLDLEEHDGTLVDEQLQAIQRSGLVSALFIISHRPIWAEDDPQYSDLFKDNTRSTFGTNFKKDVYPLLEKIAQHARVYWISGSLGGQAPSSIFFQRHAPNITFIQCAIRDEPRDALLIADVYPDTVTWSALSLTGQQVKSPESYDAAWWRSKQGKGEGFNWRLLPYLVRTTVFHRSFWWGAALMLLLVVLVRRIVRR